MKLAALLRNGSWGVAAASLLCAGAVWAQPPAPTQPSTMQRSWNLIGANARLQQKLDAKTAHRGQTVEAKLNSTVNTASGMRLDRGTELWGKVDRVQASMDGGPSTLSVVFTRAQLKNGHSIPVKVTVIGVYPSDEEQLAVNGDETMPAAPRHVSSNFRVDQQPGMIGHVSLHSAVESRESATFRDARGNLKIGRGTYLQLGIASANGSSLQG